MPETLPAKAAKGAGAAPSAGAAPLRPARGSHARAGYAPLEGSDEEADAPDGTPPQPPPLLRSSSRGGAAAAADDAAWGDVELSALPPPPQEPPEPPPPPPGGGAAPRWFRDTQCVLCLLGYGAPPRRSALPQRSAVTPAARR
jgi:hypothetical protein